MMNKQPYHLQAVKKLSDILSYDFTGPCIETSHQSLSFTYKGSCYTLYFEPVSWFEAFLSCKNKDSILALMKRKNPINDISGKIKMVHRESVFYWIGLRRSEWHTMNKIGMPAECWLRTKDKSNDLLK